MPTTKRDLQALRYLAQRLREETHGAGKWHDNGLTAVLSKLEGHNLAITVERVTRHAGDAEAKTPAAIERPFVPDAPKAPARQPAKAGGDECRVHPGEYALACRSCAADRLAGDQSAEPRRDKPPAVVSQRGAAACRTALGLPEPSPAPGAGPPEPAVDEPAPVLSPEPQDVQQRAGEPDSASQPQLQGAGARNLDAPTPAYLDARRARTDTEGTEDA